MSDLTVTTQGVEDVIIISWEDGRYTARDATIRGVATQADTPERAEIECRWLRDAYLRWLRSEGLDVPERNATTTDAAVLSPPRTV